MKDGIRPTEDGIDCWVRYKSQDISGRNIEYASGDAQSRAEEACEDLRDRSSDCEIGHAILRTTVYGGATASFICPEYICKLPGKEQRDLVAKSIISEMTSGISSPK